MTEHASHAPSIGGLLLPAINFSLFAWLLVRFLRGPIREYFRTRSTNLREGLVAGTRARQEAEALRAALARDVADLPAMRERLRADLRATAKTQSEAIIAGGREAAHRIRNDAELLAEHEFSAARAALRAEVSDEAVRQATAILRAAMRPEDQERLVSEFVRSAGVSP